MKRKNKTLRTVNLALPALVIALPCGASWWPGSPTEQYGSDFSYDSSTTSAGKSNATFQKSGSSVTISYFSRGLLFGTTWETVESGTMTTTFKAESYTWDHACHTVGESAVYLVSDPVDNVAAMTIQWF